MKPCAHTVVEGAVRSVATAVGKRLVDGMDHCVEWFISSMRRQIREPAGPGEAPCSTLPAASQRRAVVAGRVARSSAPSPNERRAPAPRAPPDRPLESWPRGARLRVQMAAAGRGSPSWQPPPPPSPTRLEMVRVAASGPDRVRDPDPCPGTGPGRIATLWPRRNWGWRARGAATLLALWTRVRQVGVVLLIAHKEGCGEGDP